MQICAFLEQVVLGKSFYTKLMILRYRFLGIEQYVIDPEREYEKLANNLNGTILKIGPNHKHLQLLIYYLILYLYNY